MAIDITQLPEYLQRIVGIIKDSYTEALVRLMDDVFAEVVRLTRFPFQKWEIEKEINDNFVSVIIHLPFESGIPGKYTALLWNNPYFKNHPAVVGSSLDIHQPLQDAFFKFGIRCDPAIDEPIPPVKWPTPPETIVRLDPNDLMDKISEYVEIIRYQE